MRQFRWQLTATQTNRHTARRRLTGSLLVGTEAGIAAEYFFTTFNGLWDSVAATP